MKKYTLFGLLTVAWLALAPPILAQDGPVAREVELKEAPRDYSSLLKRPDRLGFTPRRQYFEKELDLIRKSYADPVEDSALVASVKAELKNFLLQAKADLSGLDQLEGVEIGPLYSRIQEIYGRKVNHDLLGYVALLGLAEGVKDHHSYFMTPAEGASLRSVLRPASFTGIGVTMEIDSEKTVTIIDTVEDGPAANAGIQPGDKIVKVDGKSVVGAGMEAVRSKVIGAAGTSVTVTIKRKLESLDFTVKRAEIATQLVISRHYPGDLGYVRLTIFGAEAQAQLHAALEKMKEQHVKGLVFDLRNNGGGYIDAALGVVGEFAPAQSLVTFTLDKDGHQRDYRTKKGGGVGVPVVLLVNEYSASASELTAGAMKDLKLATLVGDRTFGKGSVQQIYPLEEASSPPLLRLTIAHFFSPNGQTIHQQGVAPDYFVEMEPKFVNKGDKDIQLKKALEVLGEKSGH